MPHGKFNSFQISFSFRMLAVIAGIAELPPKCDFDASHKHKHMTSMSDALWHLLSSSMCAQWLPYHLQLFAHVPETQA